MRRDWPAEFVMVAALVIVIAVAFASCARDGLGGYELPKIFRH